jgi:hypothetical protein
MMGFRGKQKMKKILIFTVVLIAANLISGVAYSKVNGTISGRLTDPSGNGLANAYVFVYDYNSNNWIKGSYTDSSGNYDLDVPAGTYKVQFSQLPYSDAYYAPEWYDNKSNFQLADQVTVTAFRTTSNVNAQLSIGGKISGRVTNTRGNGIADVYVQAYDLNSSDSIYGLDTDSNGDYSINLPVGTYKVHFSPSPSVGYYAPGWYADKVSVAASETTSNINAQPEIGGIISGRVTGSSGIKGIANVYVYAVDPDYFSWINGSYTDGNGNYRFNVPAGTCKVYFSSSPSSGNYAPEWYENKTHFQEGDLVTITASGTTFNVNARLEIGGTISGRVTDTWGNGIVGVYVKAFDLNDDAIFFNGATTNSKGFYAIPLAAGSYKVGFVSGPDDGNFTAEWYKNKSDFQSADTVTVKKFIKSIINVQLEPE